MKKFSQFQRRINEQELSLNKEEDKTITAAQAQPEVNQTETGEKNPTEQVSPDKLDPSKFFSKIFEARQMAHIYHLQVKGDNGSYAAHVALNSFYDDLLGLLDELIETYQGQYGIVENYDLIDTKDTNSKDKIEYFTDLSQFIKDTRKKALLEEDTHLQNIVDEIVALTYRLLYKLKFNK